MAGLLSYKAQRDWIRRTWNAWFSPEIPISDGPYKFNGLPGLITRLESTDGDYRFILAGLKRISTEEKIPKLPGYKLVNGEKFKEMQQKLMDDPLAKYEGRNITITMEGREMTQEELRIRFRKDLLDRNLIEKE